MCYSSEKIVILSGSIFGSIFLFANSLNSVNDIIIKRNGLYNSIDENNMNKLLLANGLTMIFSGISFGYFTYIATK